MKTILSTKFLVAVVIAVGAIAAVSTFAAGDSSDKAHAPTLKVNTKLTASPGAKQPAKPLASVEGSYDCGEKQGEFKTDKYGHASVSVSAGNCVVSVFVPSGYRLAEGEAVERTVKVEKKRTTVLNYRFLGPAGPATPKAKTQPSRKPTPKSRPADR